MKPSWISVGPGASPDIVFNPGDKAQTKTAVWRCLHGWIPAKQVQLRGHAANPDYEGKIYTVEDAWGGLARLRCRPILGGFDVCVPGAGRTRSGAGSHPSCRASPRKAFFAATMLHPVIVF